MFQGKQRKGAIVVALLLLPVLVWRIASEGNHHRMEEALLDAIDRGDVDAARLALQQGAIANTPLPSTAPPQSAVLLHLHSLCFWDPGLTGGAQRELASRPDNALILAIRNHQISLVRLLLAYGADPNLAGRGGFTPLMIAANAGTPNDPIPEKIVIVLLAAGADANGSASGDPSQTPLRLAAFSANPVPMVRLLLAAGAKANDQDTRLRMQKLGLIAAK